MSAPKVNRIDLKSPKFRENPWQEFGLLRQQGPVIRIRMPFFGKMWAATTYDSVNEVFKNTESFARDPKSAGRNSLGMIQWIMPRVFKHLMGNMLATDGQQHRRLRSLVDQAFAQRNIEGMNDRLEFLAGQQMDEFAVVAARDGQADLIAHFARSFPMTVICELLGLPKDDRPKFKEWFAPMTNASSILAIFSMNKGMKKLVRYLRQTFEEVRANPREGLITELVQVEHEGQQLDEDELLAMVFLLLVAGYETTVHLISNAVLTFFSHDDAKQELLSDWSLADNAIEEVLRYSSPLQMGKPRFVTRDMEFHGQPLKRGALITPLIACANYDPARFENPDQFDLHRPRNYHMSFGSGPHVCLGMKLARAETVATLKCLYQRWPDLQPAFNVDQPDWGKRLGTRSLNTLMISPTR